MVELDIIHRGKIKQGGIFNYKDFYSFAYNWLINEGYDVYETTYTEKVAGDSKQVEIKWKSERKITDYFRFVIKAEWLILGMKDIEVQKEGKKVKMHQGLLEIRFKAILEKDYENRWEHNPFWKFLRGIYDRYIIRSRIDNYEDKLLFETQEYISQCKAFLAMEGQH